MTIGQLFGIFGASIVLVFFAKFFVGGEIFVWMFLFFFGSLYILHSAHVNSLISAASGATGKVYKAGKVFLMSVLVAIILVGFIQNLTGLAIGGTGEDKLTTLLYVALLGIFAMWQAGWTKGESGKVWVRRLFVLTLIYALFSAIFPSTQKAIGRFLRGWKYGAKQSIDERQNKKSSHPYLARLAFRPTRLPHRENAKKRHVKQ